jgi:hypothetical protein
MQFAKNYSPPLYQAELSRVVFMAFFEFFYFYGLDWGYRHFYLFFWKFRVERYRKEDGIIYFLGFTPSWRQQRAPPASGNGASGSAGG